MNSVLNLMNPAIGAAVGAASKFSDSTKPEEEGGTVSKIFGTLITIFALYLVFTCKDIPGTNMVLNLIAAICCAPFYIIYRIFFKPCKKLF